VVSSVGSAFQFSKEILSPKQINTGTVTDKFNSLANGGELDFYSCLALALGRNKFSKKMLNYLPGLICTSCMQVLLGVLLLAVTIDDKGTQYYPVESPRKFRAIGFLLFSYSSWQLLGAMDDECRTLLLGCLKKNNVSAFYKWPILVGELFNKFIGMTLLVIMYVVFCQTLRFTSLLMNSIAVNFVALIDNDLVSEDMAEEAVDNLNTALVEWKQGEDDVGMPQKTVLCVNRLITMVYPFVTCALVLLFALSNDHSLCEHMRDWDPWPYCVGIDPEIQSIYQKVGNYLWQL